MKKAISFICALTLVLGGVAVFPGQAAAQEPEEVTVESLQALIAELIEQIITLLEAQIEEAMEEEVEAEEEEEMDEEDEDEEEEIEAEEEEETDDGDDEPETTVSMSTNEVKNDDGETIRTEFVVAFDVEGFGSTHYVPLGAGLNSTTLGVGFSVEDPNTNDDAVGFEADNVTSAVLSSTAPQEGAFYRLDAGVRETFTVTIKAESDNGTFVGPHRVQLDTFRFMKETDGTGAVNFPLNPDEKYQTTALVLDA